jgi:hypothetical protein
VSRLKAVIEAGGGTVEVVGPGTAWRAAEIVTAAFGRPDESAFVRRARFVGNYLRLRLLAPSLVDRGRTAVVGIGGVRPVPLVATALVAGWLAPRLPRALRLLLVGAVVGSALERNRLRRLVWVMRAVRRHAPDALLAGEFAASEPGAGVAFALELFETLGPHTAVAVTVQGPVGDRRTRAQIRLYERRFGFTVVERRVVGGDELTLLTRPRTPSAVGAPASAG